MIRVNLLGEKIDRSGEYLVQIVTYVAAVLCVLVVCFFIQNSVSRELETMRADKVLLENRLTRLEKATKQVDELEKKRKLLKEKLSTIAALKANKHGPVHILDDLNTAIPDRAWLQSLKQKGSMLEVTGIALDNQTIADFIKNLAGGKYFGDVELKLSTEYIKDEVKLKQFTLEVPLKSAIEVRSPAVAAQVQPPAAGAGPTPPSGAPQLPLPLPVPPRI